MLTRRFSTLAIVEKVLTGDRLIVRLMETATQHVQTMLLIAGVRAPNTKRENTSGGQEQPAEPYGDAAHEFVENRLVQRKVAVKILGASPQKQLIGTVTHPNGDISVFLLKAGLARCVDYHSTMLGSDMSLLRSAELFAKEKKLGIFESHAAPKSNGPQAEAVINRIQSADMLYIRQANGDEKRVNLSSVRQPKPSDPKQAPFSAEAKEFMRRRFIGKHVKVVVDGRRPPSDGFDEREMVTVLHNGNNIALALVEAGYASVLRHRMDDTDRSPIYDELLAAEAEAQAQSKGMWSPKVPEAKQYVDYSENLEKAKRLLTLLSRQKRVPAIVDYVKGASRFTLLIPRENAKLTFVLSGIQAPRSARNANETSEPFGKEAHELANRRCQQRDVEIDVEDNDKVGGFIGKLYVNRDNFAKTLLEEGFATVRTFSAEKSGVLGEFTAAETRAKEARKGLWHDYDASQEEAEAGEGDGFTLDSQANGNANGTVAPSKDYRDVLVTHVDDSCRIRIQTISPNTTGALQALTKAFRDFQLSSNSQLSGSPKAGDVVAAKFTEDGQWYRARVRRNDREAKTSDVVYVDYGNGETLPWSSLRPLGPVDRFGLSALKGQASEAALSFVQFPSSSQEYMRDASDWLMQRVAGGSKQLVARVDHTDTRDGTLWVSLFDPDEGSDESNTINAELLLEGLGMVGRKLSRWEKSQTQVLDMLKKKEEEAKGDRRGMWEYGDLTDD